TAHRGLRRSAEYAPHSRPARFADSIEPGASRPGLGNSGILPPADPPTRANGRYRRTAGQGEHTANALAGTARRAGPTGGVPPPHRRSRSRIAASGQRPAGAALGTAATPPQSVFLDSRFPQGDHAGRNGIVALCPLSSLPV